MHSVRDKFAYFAGVMLNAVKYRVWGSGNEILHFVQDDIYKYMQRIMLLSITTKSMMSSQNILTVLGNLRII